MSARQMLIWLLRMAGAAMLGALFFVFCPFDLTHNTTPNTGRQYLN